MIMQIFQSLTQKGSQFSVTYPNGTKGTKTARYDVGEIKGKYRDMLAVIADTSGFDGLGFDSTVGSIDDSWHTVNLFTQNHRYIDTVAVAGADDSDHAIYVALSQFDYLGPDYGKLVANSPESGFDNLGFSADTIQKLLDNPSQNQHYLPIISKKMLLDEQNKASFDTVAWDGLNLVSHGRSFDNLYRDMLKHDTFGELMEEFSLRQALEQFDDIGELGFDSLMDTHNRLQLMGDRLYHGLVSAGDKALQVTSFNLTKPFKRQGVANVAMEFGLSDGQTFSIFFKNPDADPAKIGANDVMVSWKWLLNKKDITAVVQPENGKNIQLSQVAMRMMKLAYANMKRFANAQAQKAKNEQAVSEAEESVAQKQALLETLDKNIADLQAQIDAKRHEHKQAFGDDVGENQDEPQPTQTSNKKAKWYENQPDNVSIYLIEKSRGKDYLKITENVVDVDYSAFISIAGVGGEFQGDLTSVKKWIAVRTQTMFGGQSTLKLVVGKDVLNNTPVKTIDLIGNEFDYEQNSQEIDVSNIDTDLDKYGKDNKTAVIKFLKTLQGKYINTQIGKVLFNRDSIDELPLGTKNNDIRAKLVFYVPQTLKNGEYAGKEELKKDRKDNFVAFHKFINSVQIGDEMVKHCVKVGERPTGEFVFVAYHSRGLYDSINTKKPVLDSISNNRAGRSQTGLDDIVLDEAGDVNDDIIIDDDTPSLFDSMMFDDIADDTNGWNIQIISITPITNKAKELFGKTKPVSRLKLLTSTSQFRINEDHTMWSNGHILVKQNLGDDFYQLRDEYVAEQQRKNKPIGFNTLQNKDIERLIPPKAIQLQLIDLATSADKKETQLAILKTEQGNEVAIDKTYLQFFIKEFGNQLEYWGDDIDFEISNGGNGTRRPISLYKGGEFIGLIMPTTYKYIKRSEQEPKIEPLQDNEAVENLEKDFFNMAKRFGFKRQDIEKETYNLDNGGKVNQYVIDVFFDDYPEVTLYTEYHYNSSQGTKVISRMSDDGELWLIENDPLKGLQDFKDYVEKIQNPLDESTPASQDTTEESVKNYPQTRASIKDKKSADDILESMEMFYGLAEQFTSLNSLETLARQAITYPSWRVFLSEKTNGALQVAGQNADEILETLKKYFNYQPSEQELMKEAKKQRELQERELKLQQNRDIEQAFLDKTGVELARAKSQLQKLVNTPKFGEQTYKAFIETLIDSKGYKPSIANIMKQKGENAGDTKTVYRIENDDGRGYELNKTQYAYAKWYYEQKQAENEPAPQDDESQKPEHSPSNEDGAGALSQNEPMQENTMSEQENKAMQYEIKDGKIFLAKNGKLVKQLMTKKQWRDEPKNFKGMIGDNYSVMLDAKLGGGLIIVDIISDVEYKNILSNHNTIIYQSKLNDLPQENKMNESQATELTGQAIAEILVNEYGWQYNSKTSIKLGRYSNDKFGEFTVSADVKDDDIVANQPLTNVFIGGVRNVVQDAKDFHRRALDWLDSYKSKPVSNENKPNDEQDMNNPNYTQSDIDYLQSIINGTLDLEAVDMDKMIEIGEKDEHDPMYEQALQIVSDYLDEISK